MSGKSSSRKGFKFAKGKKVTESEELMYEEGNVSTMNRSGGSSASASNSLISKGKRSMARRVNVADVGAVSKRRNTATDRSSSSHPSQQVSPTARAGGSVSHYPVVDFQISEKLRKDGKSKQSSKIVDFMQECCDAEKSVLEKELAIAETDGRTNKAQSLAAVVAVLESLPDQIRTACPQDASFIPELSSDEKLELQSLITSRDMLQKHVEKLSEYEEDVDLLEKDADIWVSSAGGEAAADRDAAARANSASEGQVEISSSKQYTEVLDAIDQYCDRMLQATDDGKNVMTLARQRQDLLFETFNKVRMECAADTNAPKDARSLLRQLPSFY